MMVLANGKSYKTIAPFSYEEMFQGQQRSVLSIHFKAKSTDSADDEDGYTLEEIAELYRDPSPFKVIKIYEDTPDEEGNYKFLSEHHNYNLACNLRMENIDGIERYILKIAQLTDIELAQETQGSDIEMLTECVLELSTEVYGA